MAAPKVWVVVVWLAVMASAFGVIQVSHQCRNLYSELSALQRTENRLQVEWGQYLLEQSALASLNRVEKTAIDELGMRVPDFDELIMVEP